MRLTRARRALTIAENEFSALQSAIHDPPRFKDLLVPFSGVVARVGAIVDGEAKGHHLPGFAAFWRTASQDARLQFVREWRNAEFKDAVSRTTAKGHIRTVVGATGKLRVVFRDNESFIVPVDWKPPTEVETRWSFVGGAFDGQDLVAFFLDYLTWLRVLIDAAENLTT